MTVQPNKLADQAARILAMATHDRSLLVEAGAGSGKTAVMAGRIAIMLAGGVKPGSIAAVTFTELAASELLARVRGYVEELLSGTIPAELRPALPNGLDETQKERLLKANAEIDEITCSTIHGFCQRLIKPYPVEAKIDPGAAVMDRGEADRLFDELLESWLRERLMRADGALFAEMVSHDPAAAVATIRKIAGCLRRSRTLAAPVAQPIPDTVQALQQCVTAFRQFMDNSTAKEPETLAIVVAFEATVEVVRSASGSADATSLIRLVTTTPEETLCTKAGSFRAYKRKGKWASAAKTAGLSKADGERLNDEAELYYASCCGVWQGMLANAATHILSEIVADIRPLIARFGDEKRRTAALDFDDLIFAAGDLLRDHEPVRRALAARFSHVMVDEFQDTDPLQAEIFWRLCGNPPADGPAADWTKFSIRPGALFLVGDPKQAIYRFRGADVNAYIRARETMRSQDPTSIIQISTNFRSCRSILTYVNDRFADALSAAGQPGFTPLDPFHEDHGAGPCIAALDVAVPNENGKAPPDSQRDCEAEVVAELCERLIGSHLLLDRKRNTARECRAGDIALLAPTGSELWRYEEALERRGIPVSTQAGKGLYRRQEIQDLIALTRVLADSRDTLALGALLRGPVVGLTEEELLDIVWALPRPEHAPDTLSRLNRMTDLKHVHHEFARDVLGKLQSLARKANSTTPHDLISQAVDMLRVRPILVQRYRRRAERALANIDLYLDLARPYGVRGLRAFAETMTTYWSEETRAIEGRPDAQEEAVALYTMHAAKGLEWPIVVPINAMTRVKGPGAEVTDRASDRLYCPVLGIDPTDYDAVRDAEKTELNSERIRLWYVATTRAKDLLVIPRLDVQADKSAWVGIADLRVSDLSAIDVSKLPGGPPAMPAGTENLQTRDSFAAEAATIGEKSLHLEWVAPSRAEDPAAPILASEEPAVFGPSADAHLDEGPAQVQGGRERGLVIHKLFEEVLTGETGDEIAALELRADRLIRELGFEPVTEAALGLSPTEIAQAVDRGLKLAQIVAVRSYLVPEFPVHGSSLAGAVETITSGFADAVAINDGTPTLVVDWKSDVLPDPKAVDQYRAQVSIYLQTTGIPRGLIVFVTSGTIIEVTRQVG